MSNDPARRRRAFTLVELLVVIGIIAVLISILLPALIKSREQAVKAQCASNMRQWANALVMYCNTNRGYFPYNGANPAYVAVPGIDMSWNSSVVQQFFVDYLTKNEAVGGRQKDNVLYCPTQDWHRLVQNDPTGTGGLIGYFYLPHRDPATASMVYDPPNFPDGKSWVDKKKPGGLYKNAPILTDMLQFNGANNAWAGYSNHVKLDKPTGGNFLFEDGHVTWHAQNKDAARPNGMAIDLGSTVGGWQCNYRISDPDIRNNR
jgi:prepilin-type N-terminal cleavage/methylation domain-containing protein